MSSLTAAFPLPGRCDELKAIVGAFALLAQRHAAELQAAAAELELSPHMALALLRLGTVGNTRMSEFARTMACDAGNLSGTIDRLEEAGLVARSASPSDKRVRMVRATPEGRRLAAKLARKLDAARVIGALQQLDESERKELRRTLDRLCAASAGDATPRS